MAVREPDPMQTYAGLAHRAGWDPTALRLRKHLELRVAPRSEPITGRLLGLCHEGAFSAAMAVLDGVRFPSAVTLYQRFLDMTIEGRLCLRAAAAACPAPYVFVCSPYECFLYNSASEELLLSASSPEESAARIFSRFTPEAFADGALDRIPRRSPQQWGKELADWLRVWAVRLGRASRTSPDTVQSLQAHWTLAWKDALTGRRGKAPDCLGAAVQAASDPCVATAAHPNPVDFHANHVVGVSQCFPFGMFKAYFERERVFWRDEAVLPLLGEFLAEARLLSKSKFRVENALFAFTDEATESKSWKAALTEETRIGQRLQRQDLTVYDAVTVDIHESGYGWALALLEELVRFWIEENLRRKKEAEERGPLGVQLDLFAPPPAGLHPKGYVEDILLFTLTHAFRVQTRSAEERFLAGLLVAMKTLELSQDYALPLTRIKNADVIFEA